MNVKNLYTSGILMSGSSSDISTLVCMGTSTTFLNSSNPIYEILLQWINGMSDHSISFCQKAACAVFLETGPSFVMFTNRTYTHLCCGGGFRTHLLLLL